MYPKEEVMKKALQRAASAAALLAALSTGSARAVEIIKNDDVTLDLGGRFQIQGELENSTNNVSLLPGNVGPRDNTRIYLFQDEDRLQMSGLVDKVKFHFEDAFGGEAYAGSNNLYDLIEFNAEVPVNDGVSVVAGLFKLPSNIASASDEGHLLFTSHSELLNMFFNQGYDNGLMVKGHSGLFDGLLGTSTGTPNLPQRYLPEIFQFPPPVFTRFGVGNIKDDSSHFMQEGFEKTDYVQWGVHANGQMVNDSNAGHGTLLGNISAQDEAPKGPFINGNMMLDKNYNPFLGLTSGSSLSPVEAQYWDGSIDTQWRIPSGKNTWVVNAQWNIAQYINRSFSTTQLGNPKSNTITPGTKNSFNGQPMDWGQITAQGGEFYAGLVNDGWSVAGRLDVLLPDPMMASKDVNGYYNRIFPKANPVWEITFPSLGYQVTKNVKLIAETEFILNSPEAGDTDGVYELTEVPIEASLATKASPIYENDFVSIGRMMLQFAF
jgi:hypothetical protein